jgi:thioesterase domain-containing protein
LARYLNEVCRVYDGLQYPGLNVSEPLPSSIEDIASHLILQIQRIWPLGPYCLAGYSFGGVMAFEVARQLEARGAEVQLVMLLDSGYPGQGRRKRSAVETVGHMRRHLSKLNGLERVLFFRDLAINKLKFHFLSIRRVIVVKPKECTTPLMEASRRAMRRYHPGCYGGRTVLFQSEDGKRYTGFRYAPDPTFGWKKSVRGALEVVYVPGDHISMMDEPAVSKVAERMRDFLKQDAGDQTKRQAGRALVPSNPSSMSTA